MDQKILKNDFLQIEYRTDSLRVTGLTPTGKTNLLADLSDLAPISTSYGDFHFRGGHRLWHAPESMPRTYMPDKGELKISELANGVLLEASTEPGTGIRKRIKIQLAPDAASVILTHSLINDGLWTVELAPWAITQFRLGGTVILPVPVGSADPHGLLPNRRFSFWPYARINDPRLKLDDNFVLFHATARLPPFKFGYFSVHGWTAYWLEGILFRKTFQVHRDLLHPDDNCNAEMYCNDQFVELESLAPLTKLAPGAAVDLVESWDVFDGTEPLPEEMRRALV